MARQIGNDDGERKVLADIDRYGWHCVNILAENGNPPWTFTVGLFQTWKHPELITFGLKDSVAHSALSVVAEGLAQGHRLDLSAPCDALFDGPTSAFVEVDQRHYREHVGFARWYYLGNGFPLYQVVWRSKEGCFPWEEGATEEFRFWQPVLSSRMPPV